MKLAQAAIFALLMATATHAQQAQEAGNNKHLNKKHSSAKHDIGSGAGDIGKGAGKGAGHLAAGTGKAAVSLATLHPIDAAGHLGTGAAMAGKDAGVGAVKGTGKIVKGTGKALKHLF
jgi:hypothetical protein